MAYKF